MSAPMVRATLDDLKTMTRRILKNQPAMLPDFNRGGLSICVGGAKYQAFCPVITAMNCPYGNVGDQLWVRENFFFGIDFDHLSPAEVPREIKPLYCADEIQFEYWHGKKRPSIHMPRWASRITLEITGVRVERLRDISEEDVWAEGWSTIADIPDFCRFKNFGEFWESINGAESWEANPWVFVISFRRV